MRAAIATALLLAAGGASTKAQAPAKQYPIFTTEHFVSAMKTMGQALAAANTSIARSEFEDSKAYVAISRDRLATTITFWRDRKKDDAVKMLRATLSRLDDLDAALSAEKVDAARVATSSTQVSTACEACHAVYREQDPVTKTYRLKASLN